MNWVEQDQETGNRHTAPASRAAVLEETKKDTLPVVQKEAEKGKLPFEPVHLTPVRSPGIYEGEFGSKDGDLFFHFWPYGYRQAEREGKARPRFRADIEQILDKTMAEVFGAPRVQYSDYRERNGSFYVKATGWAQNQFAREIAVKACEKLHKALGGT